jgi:hypothetical protein
MTLRWLFSCGLLLGPTALLFGQSPGAEAKHGAIITVGHLVEASAPVEAARPRELPYQPQPGDIVVYDDFNRFFHFIFQFADTAPPTHAAMVIARPDGKPALLELTGPKVLTSHVVIMDVDQRFGSYPGMVMVRRIKQPLTAEQSHDLTQFAESQVGKGFAFPRVALMATPFCPRTGLRKELFGHTYQSRNRWFCSELVVAACSAAKVIDGKACCANATYPRDLAVDERVNLSGTHHPPLLWSPDTATLNQGSGVRGPGSGEQTTGPVTAHRHWPYGFFSRTPDP